MNFLKPPAFTHVVRIKPGAHCFQDHAFTRWPQCQPPGGAGQAADPVMLFQASLVLREGPDSNGYWDCRAVGFGLPGSYGNGSIHVSGRDSVEIVETLQP